MFLIFKITVNLSIKKSVIIFLTCELMLFKHIKYMNRKWIHNFNVLTITIFFLGNSNVELHNFSLSGVFGTAAVCLIAIGAFLLVVAFCGCCGACYKFQTLLVIVSEELADCKEVHCYRYRVRNMVANFIGFRSYRIRVVNTRLLLTLIIFKFIIFLVI